MRHLLVLAAFSSLVFACASKSNGEDPQGTVAAAASADDFCGALCKRHSDCDSSTDLDTCTRKCQDALDDDAKKFRADIMKSAQTCVTKADCKTILAGDGLDDCVGEALLEVTPSDKAKALCTALEASDDKCSSDTTIDHVKCLDTMKQYNDATLEDAKACVDKACNAVWDCVNATL